MGISMNLKHYVLTALAVSALTMPWAGVSHPASAKTLLQHFAQIAGQDVGLNK